MKYPLNILILVLLVSLLPLSAWAARNEIFIEDQPNVATPENLEEPEPWKEGKSELPPLPTFQGNPLSHTMPPAS